MNIKATTFFIGGLICGAGLGALGTMEYFKNKYQKRYEEDRFMLENSYKMIKKYSESEISGEEDNDKNDSRPEGRLSPEARAAIKEKLDKNWKGTTNYAGMYKKVEYEDNSSMYPSDLAEAEHPSESKGEEREVSDPGDLEICANCSKYDSENRYCEAFDDRDVSADDSCSDFERVSSLAESPEEKAHNDHQKNKNRSPKIISADAYSELPAHIEKQVLYFYAYDEILIDEDDEDDPIDEPERLLGDCLTKYGFISNDERIIFVMNYSLDTCYEVQKVDAAWSNSH